MATKKKQQAAIMNQLCRICGKEFKHCIPMFSESGKKQDILKKMHSCLPVIVEETDLLPKQICLSCLPKLDASWELYQLCKEGQVRIERKLHAITNRFENEENLSNDTTWIDERVKLLSENRPIRIGESAIIRLVPPSPPPPPVENPASPDSMMVIPEQVMIVEQPQAVYPSVPAKETTVHSERLVQVSPSKVLVKQRVQAPKPLPLPISSSKGTSLSSRRSQILKEGNSAGTPARKKSLQMCKYCNKTFPDDIIDHHVNLHLRQSFFTCIDCNKNFRSEEAMSRHRCGNLPEPIDLDPED